MTGKYYVFRYSKHGFMFKRTKCGDQWASDYRVCWQFTKQGAYKIADFKNERKKNSLYIYGTVAVEEVQAMLDGYERFLDRETAQAEAMSERPWWI